MRESNSRAGLPLSATFVKQVNRPGVYGDGRGGYGLTLRVRRMTNGRLSTSPSSENEHRFETEVAKIYH